MGIKILFFFFFLLGSCPNDLFPLSFFLFSLIFYFIKFGFL